MRPPIRINFHFHFDDLISFRLIHITVFDLPTWVDFLFLFWLLYCASQIIQQFSMVDIILCCRTHPLWFLGEWKRNSANEWQMNKYSLLIFLLCYELWIQNNLWAKLISWIVYFSLWTAHFDKSMWYHECLSDERIYILLPNFQIYNNKFIYLDVYTKRLLCLYLLLLLCMINFNGSFHSSICAFRWF